MCRFAPPEEELTYFAIGQAARIYRMKIDEGASAVRKWLQRVRSRSPDSISMENYLDAPEFYPAIQTWRHRQLLKNWIKVGLYFLVLCTVKYFIVPSSIKVLTTLWRGWSTLWYLTIRARTKLVTPRGSRVWYWAVLSGTNMCCICLVENKAKSETISCTHSFHLNCIMKWWEAQTRDQGRISCPMCRFEPSNEEFMHFVRATAEQMNADYINYNKKEIRKWFKKWGSFTHPTRYQSIDHPLQMVLNPLWRELER